MYDTTLLRGGLVADGKTPDGVLQRVVKCLGVGMRHFETLMFLLEDFVLLSQGLYLPGEDDVIFLGHLFLIMGSLDLGSDLGSHRFADTIVYTFGVALVA
jgi:hypothetical protein